MQFYHTAQCHRCCKFEGACNWHADCRMSTRAVACELNVHFSTISRLQRRFRDLAVHPTASQPQTTCNHTSPGPPHPASSPLRSSETSHPDSCCNNRLHNQRISAQTVKTVSGKLICMLGVLIGVSTWLQFVIVTVLSGHMPHIRWRMALWRGVLFRDESHFHCTGQMADSV